MPPRFRSRVVPVGLGEKVGTRHTVLVPYSTCRFTPGVQCGLCYPMYSIIKYEYSAVLEYRYVALGPLTTNCRQALVFFLLFFFPPLSLFPFPFCRSLLPLLSRDPAVCPRYEFLAHHKIRSLYHIIICFILFFPSSISLAHTIVGQNLNRKQALGCQL
ncbi:hypothetical protein HOY80DRAFT_47276 [Tuber brumale]|nr:hypothetical protein HOY80DRAFT_47276 [Tuber brumale]